MLSTLLVLLLAVAPTAAVAQNISLIRDAEIESIIRAYADPIFDAAGLESSAVRIYLVNDIRLNAFVAGGQRLFLHTGLLMRAETPGQLTGVIAHEAGHIAGGHLARLQDRLRGTRAESIIALIIGAAAAVAVGDPRVGGAVAAGGQQAALVSLLKYSQTQESAADAAALTYLDRSGQSARGLMEFLQILSEQEYLLPERQDPYLRSHPLTRERIAATGGHVMLSRFSDVPPAPGLVDKHQRMRAKLVGFLQPLSRTLRDYPESDVSFAGRYARAIAHLRRGDTARALPLIDSLLAESPDDPFVNELKGQLLFETGQIAAAQAPYERAVDLAPNEPLLRIALAQVQIEANEPARLGDAVDNLRLAMRREQESAMAWRLLMIAHGRRGEMGDMALAQAELSLLQDDVHAAKAHAERAERELPRGSPAWLRAQDIRAQLD